MAEFAARTRSVCESAGETGAGGSRAKNFRRATTTKLFRDRRSSARSGETDRTKAPRFEKPSSRTRVPARLSTKIDHRPSFPEGTARARNTA